MSDTTLQEPMTVSLPVSPLSKGEREYQAFRRLLPSLLTIHRGSFVAIHDGEVVDSGDDDIELVQRVHKRVGYVPIYVGLVTDEQPPGRIPHYRETRQLISRA
jgi:hypothetical protein